jgi:hypothetical protein
MELSGSYAIKALSIVGQEGFAQLAWSWDAGDPYLSVLQSSHPIENSRPNGVSQKSSQEPSIKERPALVHTSDRVHRS